MKVYFLKNYLIRTFSTQLCLLLIVIVILVGEVMTLNGANVCMVKQKYNITKRVKYRAPMAVRSYDWCFAIPPRCSRWTTEMRDFTRHETEERTAEVAVCCPGYNMKNVVCVPICPNGKTGSACSEDCPRGRWGPNCVNECKNCSVHGLCSPRTGECVCQDGWKGERCEVSMPPSTAVNLKEQTLTTIESTINDTQSTTYPIGTTVFSTESTIFPTTTDSEVKLTTEFPKITSSTVPMDKTVNNRRTKMTSTTSVSITSSEEVTTQTVKNGFDPIYKNYIENSSSLQYSTVTTPETNTKKTITKKPTVKPTALTTITYTTEVQTTMKPEIISKSSQLTTKFKPKEIWIKPAQKGESFVLDSKKVRESFNPRSMDTALDNTTPKTIIVSIIPTSIAYTTFKKMSLTTAPFRKEMNDAQRSYRHNNLTANVNHKSDTKLSTSTPIYLFTDAMLYLSSRKQTLNSTVNPLLLKNITESNSYTSSVTKSSSPSTTKLTPTTPTVQLFTTNSMTSSMNGFKLQTNIFNPLTTNFFTNTSKSQNESTMAFQVSTVTKTIVTTATPTKKPKATTIIETVFKPTEHPSVANQSVTIQQNRTSLDNTTKKTVKNSTSLRKLAKNTTYNKNLTKLTTPNESAGTFTNTLTEKTPFEDETFHILTEPEHITAVVGDRDTDRNSVDLLSVLSIAGGIMMAVITVAVVIVMIERCRKPRFEQGGKTNDIRMNVVMERSDVPPPYARSIFHTPLPDPPTSDKSHYQPISTLDRNLKQFMRPVVVKTISPVMFENFRGIIECHYDHLPPRRSYDHGAVLARPITAPSMSGNGELRPPLVTESTIEALKCEAKFDVIDSTTSEPLYAEIPAWRPPSQHAIEVDNVNGEAVTEL